MGFSTDLQGDGSEPLKLGNDTISGGIGRDSLTYAKNKIPVSIKSAPTTLTIAPVEVSATDWSSTIQGVEMFELWSGSVADFSNYQNKIVDDETESTELMPLAITAGAGSSLTGSDGDDLFVLSYQQQYNPLSSMVKGGDGTVYTKTTTIDGGKGTNQLQFNLEDAPKDIQFCMSGPVGNRYQVWNGSQLIIDAKNIDNVIYNSSDGDDNVSSNALGTGCGFSSSSSTPDTSSQRVGSGALARNKAGSGNNRSNDPMSFIHDLGRGDDYFRVKGANHRVHGGKGDDTLIGVGLKEILFGGKTTTGL